MNDLNVSFSKRAEEAKKDFDKFMEHGIILEPPLNIVTNYDNGTTLSEATKKLLDAPVDENDLAFFVWAGE
jgi:hypothetical protein